VTSVEEAALNEDHNKPDPEELRDARYAELRRSPVTDEARALVDDLYTKVLSAEAPRKRQGVTKADALRAAVAGFTADLLSAAHRGGWVYRPTNKKAFTGGPVSALMFAPLRDGLRTLGLTEEMKAVQHHLGAFGFGRGWAPRFKATPKLVAVAGEHGVQQADLERHFPTPIPQEPLVLKARSGEPMKIDYTDDVLALRQAIIDLNNFLDQFTIEGGFHRGYIRIFHLGDHRAFAWDLGGRLYSHGDGNYQQLPGAERLKMTINGEAVCELDVRASYLTILHAQNGQPLDPANDPYELSGLGEAGRDVVKALSR
jgi:hypothetical protein